MTVFIVMVKFTICAALKSHSVNRNWFSWSIYIFTIFVFICLFVYYHHHHHKTYDINFIQYRTRSATVRTFGFDHISNMMKFFGFSLFIVVFVGCAKAQGKRDVCVVIQ